MDARKAWKVGLVGWLVGWLGWLVGWLAGSLIGLVGRMTDDVDGQPLTRSTLGEVGGFSDIKIFDPFGSLERPFSNVLS